MATRGIARLGKARQVSAAQGETIHDKEWQHNHCEDKQMQEKADVL